MTPGTPAEGLSTDEFPQIVFQAADAAFGAAVNVELYKTHRIIVQIPGPGVNAIKILPPVVCTDADVQYFLQALEDTLASFYQPASGPIAAGHTKGSALSGAGPIRPSRV